MKCIEIYNMYCIDQKWHFQRCLILCTSKSKGRDTMRKIAATHRSDKSPRLHCCCTNSNQSHKFKSVWICVTDRSDKILLQRQWFSHVTWGDLLQQPVKATWCSIFRTVCLGLKTVQYINTCKMCTQQPFIFTMLGISHIFCNAWVKIQMAIFVEYFTYVLFIMRMQKLGN